VELTVLPPPAELADASAWCAVAEDRPWLALHDVIASTPSGQWPPQNDVATALLRIAGANEFRHRLVLRMPTEFVPDDATKHRLVSGDAAIDQYVGISTFQRAVKDHAGIYPPSVLLQPIIGAEPGRVDVLLDGVPIGGAIVQEGMHDWFGAARPLTRAEGAVAILAQTVMRHLDRLLTADDARALGVGDFPYGAWSPVLRLLLADHTPLGNREALRRAVGKVAWGKAQPAEAARDYQLEVGFVHWKIGFVHWKEADLPLTRVPPEELAVLRAAVARSGNERAVELSYEAARALEKWMELKTRGQKPPQHLAVEAPDSNLCPYLRALLRSQYPDTAVLALEPGQ
jgi:hypothetical protein